VNQIGNGSFPINTVLSEEYFRNHAHDAPYVIQAFGQALIFTSHFNGVWGVLDAILPSIRTLMTLD
jgi:hypothetical protein